MEEFTDTGTRYQEKTCIHCGRGELRWVRTKKTKRWLLYDKEKPGIHVCEPKQKLDRNFICCPQCDSVLCSCNNVEKEMK